MTKAWSGAGSWAADSELAESQAANPPPHVASFPSLGESAATKPKKKKQYQTFSISELTVGKHVGPGGKARLLASESKGLTTDEMMMLPTGPRERSGEEERHGGLGGGFKDYGGGFRGGRENGERGFGSGFEEERNGARARRVDEPSRADENDDWGKSKKFVPTGGPFGYEDEKRRSSSRPIDRDLPSRADEADDWGSTKKSAPAPAINLERRSTARFEDARSGFRESQFSSRADDADNWGASKKFVPSAPNDRRNGGIDKDRDSGADTEKWARKEAPPRAGERPRLVLQPRTLPLDTSPPPPPSRAGIENPPPSSEEEKDKANLFGNGVSREQILAETELEGKGPATDGITEVAPKPRKVNPFGEAKPREVLLEEKGMDWKKYDSGLERRSVERPETEEEKKLKEEIKVLQDLIRLSEQQSDEKCEAATDVIDDAKKDHLKEELAQKEKELEHLVRAMNDRVWVSQKGAGSRLGHRDAGRTPDLWTRPSGTGEQIKKGGRW